MKSSFYRLGLCLVLFCSAFIQTVLPHILQGEEDVFENQEGTIQGVELPS